MAVRLCSMPSTESLTDAALDAFATLKHLRVFRLNNGLQFTFVQRWTRFVRRG